MIIYSFWLQQLFNEIAAEVRAIQDVIRVSDRKLFISI